MDVRITRLLTATALAIGLALTAGVTLAQETSPRDFFGKFEGSGITRHPNIYDVGLNNRDLDVEIGPAADGFFVAWTTVIRRAFRDTELRRKSARVNFVPSGRPGIYLAEGARDRIAEGLSWASVKGNVLSVRILAIEDDGSYVIQNYHRSLTEGGLFLQFLSDEDGQAIRTVHARLKKTQ